MECAHEYRCHVANIFGGDIVKFIGNMVKSTSATTAAKDALAKYNEALRAGSKEAQKDLVHIKLLYNGSQDMAKSYNDRIAAVKALKRNIRSISRTSRMKKYWPEKPPLNITS